MNKFTIGVICNGYNDSDIKHYEADFRIIQKLLPVRLIFIGYDPESKLLPEGTEYTLPVSIGHWYKHLHLLKIDLLFIPVAPTVFNQTSENLNKFSDMVVFGKPVITLNQPPYNTVIHDGANGFLYKPGQFVDYLKDLLENRLPAVKMCGSAAYNIYPEEKIMEIYNENE